jgi:adenylate cyclase
LHRGIGAHMGDFLAALKNAHFYRVAASYAVAAWVLLQVFNNVGPLLHPPDWTGTLLLVALALGFPVAIVLSWAHLLRRGTNQIQPAVAVTVSLLAALVLVIVPASYRMAVAPNAASPSLGGPAIAAANTLVVLPFLNLSGDPEQEFFSDGMTEEVNGALSHVSGLRVIARSSAFQFKHQNPDVRAVARQIGASDIIEGSVRKQGNRVRISAQLVRGIDGVTLWSQDYDRNLTDIFAIQEDIASSIAQALRVPLGLERGGQLVADRTTDLPSYEQYLHARALYRGRRIQEAIAILRPVVAHDPNFAPAHSLLAILNSLVLVYLTNESSYPSIEAGRRFVASNVGVTEYEARRALSLDPHQSDAYAALASVYGARMDWRGAEDCYQRALSLNPNNSDAIHLYGLMLAAVGRAKDALAMRQKLHDIEPFVPIYNIMTAAFLQLNGNDKASIDLLNSVPGSGPTSYFRNVYLARAYAAERQYAQAADTLLAISPDVKRVSRQSVEDAAHLLRTIASGTIPTSNLPALQGELVFVYAYTHEPWRVLDSVERDQSLIFGDIAPFDSPWLPLYSATRRTERFQTFARNAGLVTYWRNRRWADHCAARGPDAFACA